MFYTDTNTGLAAAERGFRTENSEFAENLVRDLAHRIPHQQNMAVGERPVICTVQMCHGNGKTMSAAFLRALANYLEQTVVIRSERKKEMLKGLREQRQQVIETIGEQQEVSARLRKEIEALEEEIGG